MKTITFRPLRIIKKTGKITVASYMQWRKVKAADYSEFDLIIKNEYADLALDEFVYDHQGEQLFWFNHKDPESLPKNYADLELAAKLFGIPKEHFEGEQWKTSEPIGKGFHWSVKGFDCDGVPVFSHNSAKYIATHYSDMNQFEPLTVGEVLKWFGWFLYQLENSRLKIV